MAIKLTVPFPSRLTFLDERKDWESTPSLAI